MKYDWRVPFAIYADFERLATAVEPWRVGNGDAASEKRSDEGDDRAHASRQPTDDISSEQERLELSDGATVPETAKSQPRGAYQEHRPIRACTKLITAVAGVRGQLPYGRGRCGVLSVPTA